VIAKLTGTLWARAIITIGVLAILATTVDLRASARSLVRLDAGAAAAVLALLAVDRAVMVWRWLTLLRASGAAISAKSATWIYLVSSFVGGSLPAGVGADAARAYALSRRTARGSDAVASVIVDRMLGLLSILIMAMVGVFVAGRQSAGEFRIALLTTAALVVGGSIAFLWADRWVTLVVPDTAHDSGLARRLFRLADAIGQYRGHRLALGSVAMLSIGVQVLRILQAYLLGRGIGIDVPFSYYLLFMPVGLIALLLPISISGIGAPQGIIVWLLRPVGVPEPDALALSTLIVLTGIIANLPGAWLYLRAARATRTVST
jgi:uncharacterized protein (TIRG00374 family)